MSILILILGILFLASLTKIVNMYYNFYHIYKDLDNEERIRYFYNNIIVKLISNRNKTKKFFIFYILIPLIKINYLILSFLISLMHSLCELELDNLMKKNGFSIQECSHQEIDKILNFNENDENKNENNDEFNVFNEINEINNSSMNISNSNIQICNVRKSFVEEINYDEKESIINNQNIENLIDEKLGFLINNQNNFDLFNNEELSKSSELLCDFNNFSLNNDNKNNEKLENFIKNKNCINSNDNNDSNNDSDNDDNNNSDNNDSKITNIIELMKNAEPTDLSNLIKINSKDNNDDNILKIDENEVLKMDDIDFGENLNNFLNNYNEENINEEVKNKTVLETNKEVLIIKTGKKKNKI